MHDSKIYKIFDFISRWDNLMMHTLLIFATLIIYQPPDGKLVPDEEMYIGFSMHSMSKDSNEYSSFGQKELKARYLFDVVTAFLVKNYGYSKTQMIGRTLSLVLYSLCLAIFFRTLKFNFLQSITCVLGFLFSGQDLFGGEWLVHCYTPKSLAYPLIFLSFSYFLRNKFYKAIVCFIITTYVHFLVGGTFFTLFLIYLYFKKISPKHIIKYISAYALITLPLIVSITSNYFSNTDYSAYNDIPDPNWIYSFYRHPHHLAPFKDLSSFYVFWLGGIIISVPLTFLSVHFLLNNLSGIKKDIALFNLIILIQLYICLVIAFFDYSYFFGKFYMFRSSSLALFLSIVLSIIWINEIITEQRLKNHFNVFIFSILLSIHIAPYPWKIVQMVRNQSLGDKIVDKDYRDLINFVLSKSEKNDIFLIDPVLDPDLLDFERMSKRPSLINHKYIPTTKIGILEWYRRLQFRSTVFNSAKVIEQYQFSFIVTKEENKLIKEKYGKPIFNKMYKVYKNEGKMKSF